jgi:hypothetical protein
MKLKILPLNYSTYIFFTLIVANNKDQLIVNSETHGINTKQSINHRLPQICLALYKRGICSLGIKIFNSLPSDIKSSSKNSKIFKTTLKNFTTNSFYSLDEYF